MISRVAKVKLLSYIQRMSRVIAHLLILLVLFTHSTMAMDVHILTHDMNHSEEHVSASSHDLSTTISTDSGQASCLDAGGHCSHHQAHTAGLISVNTLSETRVQSILVNTLNISELINTQSPPLRPPKA